MSAAQCTKYPPPDNSEKPQDDPEASLAALELTNKPSHSEQDCGSDEHITMVGLSARP